MSMNSALIAEFQQESENTRKMLERIPVEKFSWKPHDKSYDLVTLARHIAEMAGWAGFTVNANELDFATMDYTPPVINSLKDLMDLFEKNRADCIASLEKATDEIMMQPWTLRNGTHVIFTLPKIVVLRSMVFNHIIHHRGQLSVYLRLLDVPVPGMYGPSADEA